ncbi:hypothetical protein ACHQM5_012591 [Ranunculus cassubicifolius]
MGQDYSTASANVEANTTVEWLSRGDNAYGNGDLSEAESCYTRGIDCDPNNEESEERLNALASCYSNRAMVRISYGEMREALVDCEKAAQLNPIFQKDQVTVGNCHLALGKSNEALQFFEKSLVENSQRCLDDKLVKEATKGLQKAKKAQDYLDQCDALLQRKVSSCAESVLGIVAEALVISPFSEKLLERKAAALLMLTKYEETIELCDESLDYLVSADGSESSKNCSSSVWRWDLKAMSCFYLERFEDTLALVKKLEQIDYSSQKFRGITPKSLGTVRELLYHRASAITAFTLGKYSEAVEHYTSALKLNQTSEPFTAICFSGRAAALQALGKMRAALEDCKRATDINPHLHETHVRAGNCYLALGQIPDAIQYFKLPQGADLFWDRELRIEASDGLLKALEEDKLLGRCDELLLQRTSTAAERALKIINEALSISPYSEKVIERKANVLLMLRNYEEMFQLCDQSLDAADNNYYSASVNSETRMNYPARVWRSGLRAKAFFYLGRLEETLASFEMVEAKSSMQKFRSKSPEAAGTLAVTVRELLGHKGAGDEALRLGRHLEAFEHYTSALSCSLESRPFSAICLFKRAAANEALGPITNAIADCSLAIALAGNYPKALFKRATLHEMIRDYRSATTDLQRLISEQKGNQSGEFTRLTDDVIDLGEAQSRLTMVKEMAKKRGIKLDMYLILGLEPSCVASDITAAYRKAALRHHPDKAPLSLSRNGNGDNAVWKEIAPVVNKDAELLFKTIGEAYTELSNSDTRSKYDAAMPPR